MRVGWCVFCVIGCATSDRGLPCDPVQLPGPDPAISEPYDKQSFARGSCRFTSGQLTTETIGETIPAIPATIEHVIIVLRENHSFDQYFGAYQPRTGTIEVASGTASNPDPAQAGHEVPRFHDPRYCIEDASHEWSYAHLQYDNGRMDGFIASANNTHGNAGGGARVMGYYTREDLPFYYWLADNFAIADHYHSAVMGPTHANLEFYYRSTSCGIAEGFDTNLELTECGQKGPTIFDQVANGSFKVYSAAKPSNLSAAIALGAYPPTRDVGTIAQFRSDAARNELPALVFVEPDYGDSLAMPNDEHPPRDVQDGQKFVYDVVNAVVTQPVFSHTVMFITWDENGGFYDHVPPPHACDPTVPGDHVNADFKFDNYGFRVPLIAISPFAKQGYVSHYLTDHTSLDRFIEHWQNKGAMTARDANAWPLLDMFDFSAARTVDPPDPALAAVSTDLVHVGTCGSGGTGLP